MKVEIIWCVILVCVMLGEARHQPEEDDSSFFDKCDQIPLKQLKMLGKRKNVRLGSELVTDFELPVCNNSGINVSIPDSFDAREKWPYCPSLWEIRDQGDCASCWAVAVTSVMTDRYCIATEGKEQFHFSSEDLLSCSGEETAWDQPYKKTDRAMGCEGGNVLKAWKYVEKSGVVSGGGYHSNMGCRPYEFSPCKHEKGSSIGVKKCEDKSFTPPCYNKCSDFYKREYADDRRSVHRVCRVTPNNIPEIQTEIMLNGPVVAVIRLCNDLFAHNTSDVYVFNGAACGISHAVKIIGWGTYLSKGSYTPYWLVVNSWNYYWGQDKGVVKILRGAQRGILSACIEKQVSTATPILY